MRSEWQVRRLFGASRSALVLVAVMCASTAAEAATCAAIRAELASLGKSSSRSVSPAAQKWQTAQRQQSKAIAAAERDARFFRCDSAPQSPKCQGLGNKTKRMQKNLRAIDRKLAQSSGPSKNNVESRRRRLQASLAAQKCNAPKPARTAKTDSGGNGFFGKIFDKKVEQPAAATDQNYRTLPNGLVVQRPRRDLLLARSNDQDLTQLKSRASLARETRSNRARIPSGGTFRTLCVRTCDGYFFPVSFSTGQSQFADDAARCGEICPAAPTELFVHRNPGGLAEEMISLAGIPYAETENAYRYKTEFVQNCSCRDSQNTATGSKMTPLAGHNSGAWTNEDGRVQVSLRLDGPAPFFDGKTAPTRSSWSQDPLLPDQLPRGTDPATRMDLEGGFNAAIRIDEDTEETGVAAAAGDTASDQLPLLTSRAAQKASAPEPVFTKLEEKDQTRQAPSGPIRVVGPEYFVAQ
ncbi:DUF2865 domain-containing protein [Roseibium polysiphoniae]|uniref:DUF2865 domain-containing protein n=1 Tax=Roseibium polysiphoniae TaxID=2571221 RepID=UPI00329A069D